MYPFIFLRQFEFEKMFSPFPYNQPSFSFYFAFFLLADSFDFPMLKPPKMSMLSVGVVRLEQFFGELRGVLDETV